MKPKTAVLLAAGMTSLAYYGVAEVLSYRQAAEFLTQHEAHIRQGGSSEAMVAGLRQGTQSILVESAGLRLLCVFGGVATFSLVLNLVWQRLVSRPIGLLRDQMSAMSRGTWTRSLPVEQDDEIGRLVRDFNVLGPRLTFAAEQFAAASKLAAMAQIGQRVTRRTDTTRGLLAELHESLSEARCRSQAVPQSALKGLAKVAEELADLAEELETGFDAELERQGLPSRMRSGQEGAIGRVGPRQDELLAS